MTDATCHDATFAYARVATVKSILGASGWKMDVNNPQQMVASSIHFYILDHRSDFVWMCTIPKDEFQLAIEKLPQSAPGEAVEGVIHLLLQIMKPDAGSEVQSQLALMLTAYLRGTKTFEYAGRGHRTSHFGFIHYAGSKMLRPFALQGADRFPLDANTVREGFNQVVRIDKGNHPDWLLG
jgi:hypothetical protein